MSHFVNHHPPSWEFVRRESLSQRRRHQESKARLATTDKTRTVASGLWWDAQRYVDQQVPFHLINPNHLDNFNFRYQVYACPPFQRTPGQQMECNKKVPISYNVKRFAADKIWSKATTPCVYHWFKHQWQENCNQPMAHETNDEKNCSKNNNVSSIKSSFSIGQGDDLPQLPPQNCTLAHNRNTDKQYSTGLDQLSIQNLSSDNNSADTNINACIRGIRAANIDKDVINDHSPEKEGRCSHQGVFGESANNPESVSSFHKLPHLGKPSALSARHIVSYNKGRARKDTTASLISYQNNNANVDTTKDFHENALVDDLIFVDVQVSEKYQKEEEYHLSKLLRCDDCYVAQDIFLNKDLSADNFASDVCECWNNNATERDESPCRPQCVPGFNRDSACFSSTPYRTGKPSSAMSNTFTIRTTPCVELLGPLQGYTNKNRLSNMIPTIVATRQCEADMRDFVNLETENIPYMTYKIVGSIQYRLPPNKNYYPKVRLPPDLKEYQEFTRRCPYPVIGRYDRVDVANEMLLPSHQTMNLIKASRSPFIYTRDPKCYSHQPLFYSPKEKGGLCWNFPFSY